MRLIKILVIFLIGIYFLAGDLCISLSGKGIDLVEMQKKEKERKKKLKKSKHVYTNDDLKKIKDEKVNITEIKSNNGEQEKNTDSKRHENSSKPEKQKQEAREAREVDITREKSTSTGESSSERGQGIQNRDKVTLDVTNDAEGGAPNYKSEEEYWRNQRRKFDAQVAEVEAALKQEEEHYKELHNNLYINTPDLLNDQLQLKQEMEESKKRMSEYKNLLEKAKNLREEFYERARKEGIPPGWLRD